MGRDCTSIEVRSSSRRGVGNSRKRSVQNVTGRRRFQTFQVPSNNQARSNRSNGSTASLRSSRLIQFGWRTSTFRKFLKRRNDCWRGRCSVRSRRSMPPDRGVLSFEMRARPAIGAGFRSKKGFEPVERRDLTRDRFDGDRQVVLALLAAGIGELMFDGSDLVVLIRL